MAGAGAKGWQSGPAGPWQKSGSRCKKLNGRLAVRNGTCYLVPPKRRSDVALNRAADGICFQHLQNCSSVCKAPSHPAACVAARLPEAEEAYAAAAAAAAGRDFGSYGKSLAALHSVSPTAAAQAVKVRHPAAVVELLLICGGLCSFAHC